MNLEIQPRARFSAATLATVFIVSLAIGQDSAKTVPELQQRLNTAAAAQQAGDPIAVASANKFVIATALREQADLHTNLSLTPAAEQLLQKSLQLEDRADTRLALAIAETGTGRIDDALTDVAKVLSTGENNAAAWNLQGKLWMMKNEYAKAANALGKSLALQNDPEVAYTMATAFLKTNQLEKASAVFQQIQAASGDRAESHILAGRAYEESNHPAEAEAEYRKAIAIDAKASRAHYFLGLLLLNKNGWDPTPAARDEFLAEVKLNPDDFFGNYFMGYLTSQEKDYEQSNGYLKIAAAARPDWPEPYLYLGLNAHGERYDARAEEFLRKAIQLTGKDESRNNYQIRRAYFALGRILLLQGKKEEGTKYLVRSREIETKLVVNGRQQALASEQAAPGTSLQPLISSTTTATPAKDVDPTAPIEATAWEKIGKDERAPAQQMDTQLRIILASAYNDLGTSQARSHDYADAVIAFQEGERWDAKIPGLIRNLGMAAFLSKNYPESARALKIVVRDDSSDQRAASMLALSLFSVKDYAEAAKAFDRVPDAAAADPRMAYGWALSLARTHQPQRASTVLEKLLAQPVPPEMLVLAGNLYKEIGDTKNADLCFQRAKAQDAAVSAPR